MTSPGFGQRLHAAVQRCGNPVCVGLDPHLDKLPPAYGWSGPSASTEAERERAARAIVAFHEVVIGAIAGRVAAVKPQVAFYEQLGRHGWWALERTVQLARDAGLLVIGDAKRGDIASTASAYSMALLDGAGPLGCDAITVNPWMGLDTLEPYRQACTQQGRGLFVLLRTTNPGSAFLQGHGQPSAAEHLAKGLAALTAQWCPDDDDWSCLGVVVGAQTGPQAEALRDALPKAWFLVPGVGAQGGRPQDAIRGRRGGSGALVASSRGLLYGSPDEDVAVSVRQRLNELVASLNG